MKHRIKQILCALLAALMLLLTFVGCGASEEALLTLDGVTLSLNQYELMLSRMKGTLKYSGYPTDEESFWSQIITADGVTYNDYFRNSVLQEAEQMLAMLYLFEKEYKLTLPQSNLDQIDQYLDDIVQSLDGGRAELNRTLADYGVNMEMLRENYIMEDKLDLLISHVSSLAGDQAREEYYAQNYICFRQILFPLYEYLYETDENGDIIYYQENSSAICYDTQNGVTRTGTDGTPLKDEQGNMIYFTEDGRICYDKKNGVPSPLDEDEDGYPDVRELEQDEIQVITDRVGALEKLIEAGDFTTFEEYGDAWSQDDVWFDYPSGIYINLNKSYQINYIDDIQAIMADMQVGETAVVKSENAYHFVMKYEAAAGAWQDSQNADWFETLDTELAESILDAKCEKLMTRIEVDADLFAKAAGMQGIGSNREY